MRCAVIALGLILLSVGCSDSTTGQVSGSVKVDNSPLQEGFIDFIPADGKSPTAGAPIKGGEYSATVPVGTMNVKISMPVVIGKKKIYPTPDSPERPIHKEGLPAKYNAKTELKVDVVTGSQRKDFELSK